MAENQITNIVHDKAIEELQILKNELLSCYGLPLSKTQMVVILGHAIQSLKESDANGAMPIPFSKIKERYNELVNLIAPPIESTYCGPVPSTS